MEEALKTRRNADAFTLLELLTVIAVMGILAALILAGLSAAKRKAHQTKCINNVRQVGLALQQFLMDYHVYPLVYATVEIRVGYPDHGVGWEDALEKSELAGHSPPMHYYLGSTNAVEDPVWVCPSASRPPSFPPRWINQSYGYNAFGINPGDPIVTGEFLLGLGGTVKHVDQPFNLTPPLRDSAVVNPSDMMAIGDCFVGNRDVVGENSGLTRNPFLTTEKYPGSTQHAYARHEGKANVVFCDGHVESPSFKTLFDDDSDAALRRWNRDDQPHRDLIGP